MKLQIPRPFIRHRVRELYDAHRELGHTREVDELGIIFQALEQCPSNLVELDNEDIKRYFSPLPE